MKYSKELLKDIKAHAGIETIIGNFIPVLKNGRKFVAVCPFHDDHRPSLQIDPEKNVFNCYACQTGGDVFAFVEKFKKVSFNDAVKEVARLSNFSDPRLNEEAPVRQVNTALQPLYECITELQNFYKYGLSTEEGVIANDYLNGRNITPEQVEKFGLGYALKDGKVAINYLKSKGFSLETIKNIGISSMNGGSMSDLNAGRLIFPIKNSSGQVLGFSARKMSGGDDVPKYVNSPETKIFHKRFVLYNLDNASQTCKRDGYLYIVEGFMDVFALDTIGVPSVVALMGTKLTEDHIKIIKKFNVEVRLCLDGDAAGQKGMYNIMPMLDAANIPYRIVSLPGEVRDPDEIIKQSGNEALKNYISTLVEPFEFALNFYTNTADIGNREDKEKLIEHFAPMLHSVKSELVLNDYLIKLSKVTGFEVKAIKDYLDNRKNQVEELVPVGEDVIPEEVYVEMDDSNITFDDIPQTAKQVLNTKKEIRRLQLVERAIMLQMINHDKALLFFEKKINYLSDEILHKLALYLLDYYDEHKSLDLSSIMDVISLNDDKNKGELMSTLVSLMEEESIPEYTESAMEQYAEIINAEREKIQEKKDLDEEIQGTNESEKIRKMKEFLQKKQQNINEQKARNKGR